MFAHSPTSKEGQPDGCHRQHAVVPVDVELLGARGHAPVAVRVPGLVRFVFRHADDDGGDPGHQAPCYEQPLGGVGQEPRDPGDDEHICTWVPRFLRQK